MTRVHCFFWGYIGRAVKYWLHRKARYQRYCVIYLCFTSNEQ